MRLALRMLLSDGENWTMNAKVNVKLSLCFTKYRAMKTYSRDCGIAPHILDLSFTHRPLYLWQKSLRYPLDTG